MACSVVGGHVGVIGVSCDPVFFNELVDIVLYMRRELLDVVGSEASR